MVFTPLFNIIRDGFGGAEHTEENGTTLAESDQLAGSSSSQDSCEFILYDPAASEQEEEDSKPADTQKFEDYFRSKYSSPTSVTQSVTQASRPASLARPALVARATSKDDMDLYFIKQESLSKFADNSRTRRGSGSHCVSRGTNELPHFDWQTFVAGTNERPTKETPTKEIPTKEIPKETPDFDWQAFRAGFDLAARIKQQEEQAAKEAALKKLQEEEAAKEAAKTPKEKQQDAARSRARRERQLNASTNSNNSRQGAARGRMARKYRKLATVNIGSRPTRSRSCNNDNGSRPNRSRSCN